MTQKGFTLVEVLVVMAIIGLLATIAVINVRSSRDKARLAAALHFETQLRRTLADSLAVEWNFEGPTGKEDSSGQNNTIDTLQGEGVDSIVTTNGCLFGKCLQFATLNGQATKNANAIPFVNNFTISMWVTLNVVGGVSQFTAIGNAGANVLTFVGAYAPNDSRIYGLVKTIPAGGIKNSQIKISTGDWHHIAILYDGVYFRKFLDGKQIHTNYFNSPLDLTFAGGPIRIGGGGWTGMVDSVRIYTDAPKNSFYNCKNPPVVPAFNEDCYPP